MDSSRGGTPWSESAVLGIGLLALLIAGAVAGNLSSSRVWTLVAALAALYMLSRGFARGRWNVHSPRVALVQAAAPAAPPASVPAAAPAAPATPERRSETEAEVILSEERINVTSRPRPRERVQVRKEIVTEEVTITVPVRREELRIERVPLDAPDHPDSEMDVTLMTHEPVVAKEIVPTERVRLEKDVITERERVSEPVRKERVDFDRSGIPDPSEGAR